MPHLRAAEVSAWRAIPSKNVSGKREAGLTEKSAKPDRGGGAQSAPAQKLCQVHLLGLQTLGAALDDERHASAFIEGAITAGLDRRKVDENVLAIVALDETESFSGVKPLHCTCFFHCSLFSFYIFLAMKIPTSVDCVGGGNRTRLDYSSGLFQMDAQVSQKLLTRYHEKDCGAGSRSGC